LFSALLNRERLAPEAHAISRRPAGGPAPLSFAQERLWVTEQMAPGSAAYNIAAVLRLEGELHPDALELALTELIRRHESLRTTFIQRGETPEQVIDKPHPAIVPVLDLRETPPDERERAARRLATEEAQRPFDLARGPLLRVSLLRFTDRSHWLLVTMHHIISDGWSLAILVRELTALYVLAAEKAPLQLADPPLQYADYVTWQREQLDTGVLEPHLAYWRRQLEGVPTLLSLPTGRPRPPALTFRGALHRFLFPPALLGQLRALARSEDATLFMALLAAFQTLLHRYTGVCDFVLGTPVANRGRRELEGIIGFFINMLALRADLTGDPSTRDLLRRTRTACLDAYAHQDVPFERLVEALEPVRHPGYSPVFQVAFALQNAPYADIDLPNLRVTVEDGEIASSPYDLTLSVRETEEGLAGSIEYSTDLFEAGTIERMTDHFQTLLADMVRHPGCRLSELSIIPDAERRLLLEWTASRSAVPAPALQEQFDAQAARTPSAPALAFSLGGRFVHSTYAELAEDSNRLASQLRAAGTGPEVCVGVCLDRSPLWATALLAVLKSGGACVLLEPAWPAERIHRAIAAAGVTLLLTDQQLAHGLPSTGTPMVTGTTETQLAFVIFTSGSTGDPKGVMVPHAAVSNHCAAVADAYGLEPADRVLQFASAGFDVAIEELFPAWSRGAAVVLPPWKEAPSIAEFVKFLESERVSIVNLPSSYWHAWVEELDTGAFVPEPVRLVIAGSEPVRNGHLASWQRQVRPEVAWRNAYGTTEAAITTTLFDPSRARTRAPGPAVPVGQPLANCQAFVLDAHMGLAPIGVPGELWIGGAGLARGYIGDAARTAERFLPHPFATAPGKRLYRTGDRARWLADGTLEILGRIDRQVKVRGFRIEPAEIEAALARHPSVRACAVSCSKDPLGNDRLVAHVVPAGSVSAEALRQFLAETLPAYMLPSGFTMHDVLPLTRAGKIDHHALASAVVEPPRRTYVAPRNWVESTVAAVWGEVLQLERIGIYDNFFELGGHSLLATRLVSRLAAALHVDIPLRSVFEHPTIAGLAARLGGMEWNVPNRASPTLPRIDRDKNIPLSVSQEQVWWLERLLPGTPLFNMPFAMRLHGPLDAAILYRCLDEIVSRHEALRTRFTVANQRPVQEVAGFRPIDRRVTDLSELTAAGREVEVESRAGQDAFSPFDLAEGRLLRASVMRLGPSEHVILLTLHHIAADGWSVDVLANELAVLYDAFSSGKRSPLPELPLQYRDFAAWQRAGLASDGFTSGVTYWNRRLSGLPAQILPVDRPRRSEFAFETASVSLSVPKEVTDGLKQIARTAGATLFTVVLSAFKVFLYRMTGQTDLRVATITANRQREEVQNLIGLFANTVVLRSDLAGNPAFLELVERVRATVLEGCVHQNVPFDHVVKSLQAERGFQASGLVNVEFHWEQAEMRTLHLPGIEITPLRKGNRMADLEFALTTSDLVVSVVQLQDSIEGTISYKKDVFDAETIERLGIKLEHMLRNIALWPQAHLLDLEQPASQD
jgi:amino acid adenylation domain-containing protein